MHARLKDQLLARVNCTAMIETLATSSADLGPLVSARK
jgi:hypothetical protein